MFYLFLLTLLHFQILVPPRAIVYSAFGQDGYFPFRPWWEPLSNQFFYRSYDQYRKSLPSVFLSPCKIKSSITTKQRVLIPRAHIQAKTVS